MILKEYITEILIAVSGIGAFINERLKSNQLREDLKASRTENIQKIVDLYQDALSDLKDRYDKDTEEIKKKYEGIIADIRKEYDSKFKVIDEEMKRWKAKYEKLKKDFDLYREKQRNE